jgi:hypothetical protein
MKTLSGLGADRAAQPVEEAEQLMPSGRVYSASPEPSGTGISIRTHARRPAHRQAAVYFDVKCVVSLCLPIVTLTRMMRPLVAAGKYVVQEAIPLASVTALQEEAVLERQVTVMVCPA